MGEDACVAHIWKCSEVQSNMAGLLQGIKKHGIGGCCRYTWIHCHAFCRRRMRDIRIAIAKLRADDCYVVKDIQGSKMLLNLNDVGISQELFFTGVHETNSTEETKRSSHKLARST